MMLTLLAALTLAQSQPAVRRSTPAADDLGMVVRQAGAVSINCISGCSNVVYSPDGGPIGSVTQGTRPCLGAGTDGGPVQIEGSISATNPSVGSTGAAAPTSATLIGGTDGTNLRAPYVITTTPDAGDPGIVVRVVGGISGGGSGGAVTQGSTPWPGASSDAGILPVTVENTVTVAGTVAATQSGTWNINNVSGTVSLPTGAATSALQTSGNASLTSIDGKTPALGQTTMAGSSPVVIASNQTAVPVSGTVTANAGTGTFAVSAATLPLPTGAATAANQTTINTQTTKLNDGTDTALITAGGALLVDGSGSTQPISGTVAATQSGTWNITNVSGTVSLPTGAATASNQTTLNTQTTKLNDGTDTALITGAGALVVDGSGSTQPVSGTVTANAGTGTFAVSAASLPLPTGAATETTLGTRLADATFTGRFPAASLLADNTANPTLTASANFGLMWDGSTWDRIIGNSTDGLTVNLGANNDVTVTSISAGTNYIGKTRLTDGTLDLSLLNAAPGSDTGQVSVPVRIISSLAGGAGGTSSSFAAAFPATGTAAGYFDGTNMQGARVYDTDTGAGSQYTFGANLRIAASGGSLEAAAGAGTTSASVLRVVLPTDQTAIPITDNGGTITVDGTVAVSNTFLLDATFTARFAAAAALSDNFANPTTTQMGAMQMVWDGATWDRAPGNSTDGQLVNLGANNDVTVTGTVTANQGTPGSTANRWPVQLTDGTDLSLVSAAGALLVDASATTQPVSGSVTVTQATAANLRAQTSAEGATGSAVPANATHVGFRDTGGTLRPGLATDVDTSGSTIYSQGVTLVAPNFGAPAISSIEGVAIGGSTTGLVTREVLKTATSVVGTSVTCATTATAAPASPLTNRHSVCIYNNGSNTIFVGPVGVTTANGFPVVPGASFCEDVNTTQVYSCIVASGTENARVLEN